MKIYDRIVIDMFSGEVLEENSHEYLGPVAQCKGGGGSSTTESKPPAWMEQYMPKIAEAGWGLLSGGQPSGYAPSAYTPSAGVSPATSPFYWGQNPLLEYLNKQNQPGTPTTTTPGSPLGFTGLTREGLSNVLQYYPGRTVAGFTPAQTWAQTAGLERAMQGNPLLGQSQGYAGDVLSGKYLDVSQNPAVRAGIERAIPDISGTAELSGRYGSGAFSNLLGDAMGSVIANTYNQERANQQAMAQYAPYLAQQDYYDIGQAAAIGEEQQAMEQALINADINKWDFSQLAPWQALGLFTNLISGDYGGTSITKTSGGGK